MKEKEYARLVDQQIRQEEAEKIQQAQKDFNEIANSEKEAEKIR